MIRWSIFLIALSLILFSCTGEYAIEDELYACLENEFEKSSLNLEDELDTLEVLFLEEGLLQSVSPEDYRNYYQNSVDHGAHLLQSPFLKNIKSDVYLDIHTFELWALRKFDGETYDQSKFAKISHMIDSTVHSTGQITLYNIATAHLTFLTADDFEHPFYRANILLSMQYLYVDEYLNGGQEYTPIRPIPKKAEYNSVEHDVESN